MTERPEHAAARERTDAEQAALDFRVRCVVHIPPGAIPLGNNGWMMPGPPPSDDAEPFDWTGWEDLGYTEDGEETAR